MATHVSGGKSCNMGTRNCRQPFQCPSNSIIQMRLKIRMNIPAMLRNCNIFNFNQGRSRWEAVNGHASASGTDHSPLFSLQPNEVGRWLCFNSKSFLFFNQSHLMWADRRSPPGKKYIPVLKLELRCDTNNYFYEELHQAAAIFTIESKEIPPCGFLVNFLKQLRIFNQIFTSLLLVHIYIKLHNFVQLTPTLTKLCRV